jgi:catechol 2,3-dioxygenase-like lactoylglutathione lyase family enzyme
VRFVSLTLAACALGLVSLPAPAAAQTAFANLVDHLHLAAPDQPKAVAWYHKYFGGEAMTEGTDRLMFGETRVVFQKAAAPQPSAGSVLDHVGFSVADVDATMKQFAADGVKITAPVRDIPNLFKIAFVEDPWGTRIEVVQDPQKLGLHHIHLRAPDPAAALAWYVSTFGGKAGKLKGQIDGVDFNGVWLLAAKGDAVPSAGHSIDHIGFRPINLDTTIAKLKTENVKVTSEPRALTLASGASMHIAFVEGIDGVRIELVQR